MYINEIVPSLTTASDTTVLEKVPELEVIVNEPLETPSLKYDDNAVPEADQYKVPLPKPVVVTVYVIVSPSNGSLLLTVTVVGTTNAPVALPYPIDLPKLLINIYYP
jgi:hypothetical protein